MTPYIEVPGRYVHWWQRMPDGRAECLLIPCDTITPADRYL